MTFQEIERRIQAIRDAAGDAEVAHGMEDKLREGFIEYVASLRIEVDIHLPNKAELILSTKQIRWCA